MRKTGILSLLAGAALLTSVGMASAAEPMVLSPSEMDTVTAGGSWDHGRKKHKFFVFNNVQTNVAIVVVRNNNINGNLNIDIDQSNRN
jgi:hypothetical protein